MMEIRYGTGLTFDTYKGITEAKFIERIEKASCIYIFKDFMVARGCFWLERINNPSVKVWLEIHKRANIKGALDYMMRHNFIYENEPEIMAIILRGK
jgi:hypothetical protein